MNFLNLIIASAKKYPFLWLAGAAGTVYLVSDVSTPASNDPLLNIDLNGVMEEAPHGSLYAYDPFLGPSGKRYSSNFMFAPGTPLPKFAPTGFPWIFWHGSLSAPFGLNSLGLDSSGQFWSWGISTISDSKSLVNKKDYSNKDQFIFTSFGGGASFLDGVSEALTTYVLPAMAALATAIIPGVGGVVAAAVLIAATKMAHGASVTESLVQATRDALPALRDNRAFDAAYRDASALYKAGQDLPGVQSAVDKAKKELLTPEQRTAYDQGASMALAQSLQTKAIEWLKANLPKDRIGQPGTLPASYAKVIDDAMAHGAALSDVAEILAGKVGLANVYAITQGRAPGHPTFKSLVS